MVSSLYIKAVAVIAVLILAPAIIAGGWWLAVFLVVIWLAITLLGPSAMRAWENSYFGKKAGRADLQDFNPRDNDENWGRD